MPPPPIPMPPAMPAICCCACAICSGVTSRPIERAIAAQGRAAGITLGLICLLLGLGCLAFILLNRCVGGATLPGHAVGLRFDL